MALFEVDNAKFSALKGKTVVISGGATGIGKATVSSLALHGANVVLGDINETAADELVDSTKHSPGEVTFVICDVSKHQDIVKLFKTAHEKYGRIDHAISCAGIFENTKWFDPELTPENIESDEGNSSVLDINVLGSLRFARVAVVFLRGDIKEGEDKSLTLLSSVNAFRESPGLFLYQTSKHAIHGFMRASRKPIYERDHIRINCVCPGMTDTPMTEGIVEKFRDAGLFWQSAEAVAKIILGVQCSNQMNGKAIYVEGGDGWEFEDSFVDAQPQWLGEEATRRMRVNTEAVNKVIPRTGAQRQGLTVAQGALNKS